MDGFFNILLIIDAVLAGIAFIVLIVKSGRSFYSAGNAKKTELVAISDGGTVKLLSDPNSKPAAAVEEKVIPLSGKTQEQSDELAAQELSATSVTIGDVDDAAQNPFKFGNLRIKRRPFAEKMLGLSLDVKEYYDKYFADLVPVRPKDKNDISTGYYDKEKRLVIYNLYIWTANGETNYKMGTKACDDINSDDIWEVDETSNTTTSASTTTASTTAD